ncbi:PREDICTED: protein COFACTOR ASSEMBLY OF COMPLEX C SUBUNIT B CCB3, chloroplastic-like isoform X2 [Camelina sativa]|uniref:Protein COFACTOR ASSEMBLY OF COMPLEX C SUBUNIT B CCB3, chloroplastic-like isoform X2 n=1 Tax=Camelina sativa TaxID=90675 RepID=A0ABM0V420_CAMSA|nr:PREDICTED: protein COFACTOR ASSEMBLY OF COMPLEX C SUBUNIT B CCB3, chloroplastic-like isoform X2 [Camelina sativa]
MTTIASGFVSFSPALLHAKSRRSVPNFRNRSPSLPIVSASLRSNVEAETTTNLYPNIRETNSVSDLLHNITLADLDPGTAKVAVGILGPALSAFGFLFIVRIVMSWYPKLPVDKFPYVLAYAPTEPILAQTRKVIPPLAGVDVTPVVWFGLLSFLSEILVGPQGLLVLVSQQQVS